MKTAREWREDSAKDPEEITCPKHGALGDFRCGFLCGCYVKWPCGKFHDCEWHRERWQVYLRP